MNTRLHDVQKVLLVIVCLMSVMIVAMHRHDPHLPRWLQPELNPMLTQKHFLFRDELR